MITAERLKFLTELGPNGLSVFIGRSGYTETAFKSAKFLGITNAGQLCYHVSFFDNSGNDKNGKIFLTYDHATERVSVDF